MRHTQCTHLAGSLCSFAQLPSGICIRVGDKAGKHHRTGCSSPHRGFYYHLTKLRTNSELLHFAQAAISVAQYCEHLDRHG